MSPLVFYYQYSDVGDVDVVPVLIPTPISTPMPTPVSMQVPKLRFPASCLLTVDSFATPLILLLLLSETPKSKLVET